MTGLLLNRILIGVMGLIAAAVVMYVSRMITIQKPPAKRVREMTEDNSVSAIDRGSESLLTRMGLSLDAWRNSLTLAKLGGAYQTWSVGGMLFRGLILAAIVAIFFIFISPPIYTWFFIPVVILLPILMVNGKASDTKRIIQRLLPETVTVIAAEMDAGSTAAQAVSRAAELPSPLGQILTLAVTQATQSGRTMFSHGSVVGVLVEEIENFQIPELTRFALQLDRVASKGVDAPRVMIDIAKGLTREYRSHVQKTAANMDTALLMPMTIFFFLPFILTILVPLVALFVQVF